MIAFQNLNRFLVLSSQLCVRMRAQAYSTPEDKVLPYGLPLLRLKNKISSFLKSLRHVQQHFVQFYGNSRKFFSPLGHPNVIFHLSSVCVVFFLFFYFSLTSQKKAYLILFLDILLCYWVSKRANRHLGDTAVWRVGTRSINPYFVLGVFSAFAPYILVTIPIKFCVGIYFFYSIFLLFLGDKFSEEVRYPEEDAPKATKLSDPLGEAAPYLFFGYTTITLTIYNWVIAFVGPLMLLLWVSPNFFSNLYIPRPVKDFISPDFDFFIENFKPDEPLIWERFVGLSYGAFEWFWPSNVFGSFVEGSGFLFLCFSFVFVLIVFIVLSLIITIAIASLTLVERRVLSLVQRRVGPNHVGYRGRLQFIADALKLLLKGITIPDLTNRKLFVFIPAFSLFVCYTFWLNTMWGPNLSIAELEYNLVYAAVMSGFFSICIVLTGIFSRNKYAVLAAVRCCCMFLNLEILIGFLILFIVGASESFSFSSAASTQTHTFYLIFLLLPIAPIVFITFLLETNRAPFDLTEAESELVAGYTTELGGFFFALFYLGEYFHLFLFSLTISICLFGAWY